MARPIAYIMTADIKTLELDDIEKAIEHLDASIENFKSSKKMFEEELRERLMGMREV